MKIERIDLPRPPKPPPEFVMRFCKDDGWMVVAAIREYAANHRGAARGQKWLEWAADLESELRRDSNEV